MRFKSLLLCNVAQVRCQMGHCQSRLQRAELGLEYELLYTSENYYNAPFRIIKQMATFQVKVQTEK